MSNCLADCGLVEAMSLSQSVSEDITMTVWNKTAWILPSVCTESAVSEIKADCKGILEGKLQATKGNLTCCCCLMVSVDPNAAATSTPASPYRSLKLCTRDVVALCVGSYYHVFKTFSLVRCGGSPKAFLC